MRNVDNAFVVCAQAATIQLQLSADIVEFAVICLDFVATAVGRESITSFRASVVRLLCFLGSGGGAAASAGKADAGSGKKAGASGERNFTHNAWIARLLRDLRG